MIEFPDLDQHRYRMRITPVSAFSATLTGRIAEVDSLIKLNVLTDPTEIRRSLQLGDISADTDLEIAGRELAERVCGELLEKGEQARWLECEPEWDPLMFGRVALMHLYLGQRHDAPEDRLGLLRAFLRSCQQRAAAQMQSMAAAVQPPAPSNGQAVAPA